MCTTLLLINIFYPFSLKDSNGYNAFTGREGNSLAPELAPSKPTDQNPYCFQYMIIRVQQINGFTSQDSMSLGFVIR